MPLSVLRGQRKPTARWLQTDSLLAAALLMYEDSLCPGCGQPLDESTDPSGEKANPYRTHQYDVSDPTTCFACFELERARQKVGEAEHKHPAALRLGVTREDIDRGGSR